jgi:hypothetical protein
VPRFILKNFTKGKKPQLYVYDKSNDNIFKTNIKNIATESGFYDLEIDNNLLTLEPSLADLEGNTAGIVKKLIKAKRLDILDEDNLAILAAFLAVQFVRTKEHRLRFKHLDDLFAKKLKEMGVREENITEIVNVPTDIPHGKWIGFRSVINANDFVPHLLNKAWVLFETSRKYPFYISDNPITLHNELDHGPYGNLGLAVKGIEIYLPISTTLCIGLLCPSLANKFLETYDKIKLLDQIAPGRFDAEMGNLKFGRAFCEGIAKGIPIKVIEDNVTMLNSLQVMFSSRFVYCETNSFDLIKRMINDNNKYREGLKPTVS